ncbi:Coat F domain protein [compost metagenome]
MAAAEATNPVVRRVLAAQIENYIEMAYEIFTYQNKHGYYQVPQLDRADAQNMLNAYAPATGHPQMPLQ